MPRLGKRAVRLAGRRGLDVLEGVTGRRDPLTPPRHLMFDGTPRPSVYKRNGQEFLRHFIELGGLEPHHAVLEIGSGIGRKAGPLAHYLDPGGRYEGLEPVKAGVEWCTRHLTARFPYFRFHHLDLYNGQYNPNGRIQPGEVRFAFEDASFDFVILSSVLTHMVPGDVDHYLSEVARLVRPGGTSFTTWFVLDEEATARVEAGTTSATAPRFGTSQGVYRVENPEVPEQAIAYQEAFVREAHRRWGLQVREPVRYGWWSGRPSLVSYQDIVVASPS